MARRRELSALLLASTHVAGSREIEISAPTTPAPPTRQLTVNTWSPRVTNVDQTCPYYLLLDPGFSNKFGLGHAFMQINSFVMLASTNNVTVLLKYHVNCNCGCNAAGLNETNKYFFGDYFMRNAPPSKVWASGKWHTVTRAYPEHLGRDFARLRAKGACNQTLLVIANQMPKVKPLDDGFSLAGWRAAFNSQQNREERLRQRRADRSRREVRLAVHIRRGEVMAGVLQGGSVQKSQYIGRLTPNRGYVLLIRQTLGAMRRCASLQGPITVVFVVEGGQVRPDGAVAVPDMDRNFTLFALDDLPGVDKIELAGSSVIDAFEALCYADVVVGSKSGTTYTAAMLCEGPIFIAMPFWHSYAYAPNVVMARERNATVGEYKHIFPGKLVHAYPVVDVYDFDDNELMEQLARQPWCAAPSANVRARRADHRVTRGAVSIR